MTEIQSNSYSVFISNDISKEINRFFKSKKSTYSKIFILVDENSLKFCYPQLVEKIEAFEAGEIIEIDSGEQSKTLEVCMQIWSALSEYGADRKSLFVNIGGGVIGDMGGFIASTFKRGIDFINIPTTLLSQVDASIGGKVGVDLNHLKNEIGVFNNPVAVFVNSAFLNSLDKRQILSGFAEIIKHALIADANYWRKVMQADFADLNSFDDLITTSIHIKNTIVKEDPKEQNLRKVLNFGHTIGHAVETFSLEHENKKHLLHGEAIAVGMVCEAYLSHKICKLSKAELSEITEYIIGKYKAVRIDEMDSHRLIELMRHDKKNEKGDILFSLLSGIGKCEINKKAKADQIIESLKYYTEQVKLMNK
ncbi:MAG: 3-dehydroquinate synthase [Bacteroidetes bacterium]|nr:3-dehydroquinate synthase [Bacteroidota bacterium]